MRRVTLTAVMLACAACSTSTSTTTSMPVPSSETTFKPAAGAESDGLKRARAHTELAAGYYELRNMSIALEEVNEAVRSEPNYGPAYNVAGLIYSELKEDRLAQENFQRALRINPLDSDANNNYGRFLCDRKREEDAIRYFLAALRNPLYQTPDRAYVNAGLCSRRRGDVKTAEEYFQKALQARPTQPQALYQLAEIAYARGAYERSKAYLMRLEKLTAPNAEVLWLALRVERKLGERDAVASYGTQLTKNFPDSKEAQAFLAGRDE